MQFLVETALAVALLTGLTEASSTAVSTITNKVKPWVRDFDRDVAWTYYAKDGNRNYVKDGQRRVFPYPLATQTVIAKLLKASGGTARTIPRYDNTEGIQAYHSILAEPRKYGKPFEDCPMLRQELNARQNGLWVDTGAGKPDNSLAVKSIIEKVRPGVEFRRLDPFNLRGNGNEINIDTVSRICEAGGTDVSFSMSILNVILHRREAHNHIRWVHSTLKQGGVAVFKIWAGRDGMRGSGVAEPKKCQKNRLARDYFQEIQDVFPNARLVDSGTARSQNLIWATKTDVFSQDQLFEALDEQTQSHGGRESVFTFNRNDVLRKLDVTNDMPLTDNESTDDMSVN